MPVWEAEIMLGCNTKRVASLLAIQESHKCKMRYFAGKEPWLPANSVACWWRHESRTRRSLLSRKRNRILQPFWLACATHEATRGTCAGRCPRREAACRAGIYKHCLPLARAEGFTKKISSETSHKTCCSKAESRPAALALEEVSSTRNFFSWQKQGEKTKWIL